MKRKNNKKEQSEQVRRMSENELYEMGEDITKYGEFVSSYFSWLTLEGQKERAHKMEDMTEKNK